MMDARKFLINLLYRATAQSSEVPGWSHRQTKNFIAPILRALTCLPLIPQFDRSPELGKAGHWREVNYLV
jgi:hypothetical protein